jgi:hypothetical protein
MQLLIDPFRKPHVLDTVDISRPQAVAETIESVEDGLLLGEISDRQAGENGSLLRARRRIRGAVGATVVLRG